MNLPRFIFAIIAFCQEQQWHSYAKVRFLSVFIFWPLLAILQVERIHRVIFLEDEENVNTWTYIREVIIIILIVVMTNVDYQLTKLIEWEVKRRQTERLDAEKS